MPFQSQVFVQPAPGIAGDFVTSNPRASVLAGPGGLVCGPSGVTVGRFAWLSNQFVDQDNAPQILNNFGFGPVAGFVGRHQQGLITTYLAEAGMVIPQGREVTAYSAGDFFMLNSGTTYCQPLMKAYANLANGAVSFAATGAAPTSLLTTSSIAAATALAATGSISGNVLTLTAVSAGLALPGSIITGTNVATGTQIVAQLTSTASLGALGTTGTYALSIGEQTIASEAIAGTYGVLTVGAGTPISGGVLSGGTAAAGTTVWGQLTATTWVVSPSQTVASATLTEATGVETKWIAMSGGAAGEIIKCSSWALG